MLFGRAILLVASLAQLMGQVKAVADGFPLTQGKQYCRIGRLIHVFFSCLIH